MLPLQQPALERPAAIRAEHGADFSVFYEAPKALISSGM
jgi:hypothetical protein